MSSKLDDLTQSAIFIPYSDLEEEEEDGLEESKPFFESYLHDLPDGEELRWDSYRAAWTKCLDRVQEIVKSIYEPVMLEVVESVQKAHESEFPGLPYPEIPAITITSPSPFPAFIQQVVERLGVQEKRKKPDSYIAHLSPAECVNMTATMKAFISGFITQTSSKSQGFKSSGRTLAPYDVRVLDAWYQDLAEKSNKPPKLVVVLHEFEQFDSSIIEDFVYICSLQLRQIPLVFIICLSSPSSPTYLHNTYPRSTLALLRIQQYAIPSGVSLLERICLETFASLEHEPDLVLGPAMLESLVDHFTRYDSSLDSLIDSLQLAHLKHFSIDPLTLLHHETPSQETMEDPSSLPFLDTLLTRIHDPVDEDEEIDDWQTKSIRSVMKVVKGARKDFYAHARRVVLAFNLVRFVQKFAEEGHEGLDLQAKGDFPKYVRLYVNVLRGDLNPELADLEKIIRRLDAQKVVAFMGQLKTFLESVPEDIDISEALDELEQLGYDSSDELFTDEEDARKMAAENPSKIAEWLLKYIRVWTEPLDRHTLWEVWYTRESPFPSQIVNPSVRASVVSGLLRPKEFVSEDNHGDDTGEEQLWEYPDTSILFHRYLDSGKMINIYDWFESFHVVLETQRNKLKEKRMAAALAERKKAQVPDTPSKRRSGKNVNGRTPSKRKGKEKERSLSPPPAEDEEEDEEKWNMQVHARFIRALHELDYMGFVKHTKRKQDSVLRTVFDVSG
ncbi:Origin recognition complex subunit 3 [Marasmius crinis-equi]|uniref:Origin recognition complex subunit 3 n=1 Tax=Marasmius crinis-equi TaxID=585013 RepID=A0ABR3F601_9AGAR